MDEALRSCGEPRIAQIKSTKESFVGNSLRANFADTLLAKLRKQSPALANGRLEAKQPENRLLVRTVPETLEFIEKFAEGADFPIKLCLNRS